MSSLFNLSISLCTTMKRHLYILIYVLSFLLIYIGGGKAFIDYCTSDCGISTVVSDSGMCCCCSSDFSGDMCADSDSADCCKTAVHEVDLLYKASVNDSVILPDIRIIELAEFFHNLVVQNEFTVYSEYYPPPSPDSSRFYLHLFSTLII